MLVRTTSGLARTVTGVGIRQCPGPQVKSRRRSLGGRRRSHGGPPGVNSCDQPTWILLDRNSDTMPLRKVIRVVESNEHSVHDVFTPTRPAARLNYVARPALDNRLVDALRTPGKQLIVYGESGSGKSTLLRNKLQEVYEAHIKTQCSSAMSYDQLLLDAFDQLDQYYTRNTATQSSRSVTPSIAADFKAIRLGLNANLAKGASSTQERILPPQLTAQRLAIFLGELKMCWLIEDFHKIREDQKALFAQSLKIFSDMSDTYPEVKTITIGATETAREVVKYDSDMTKRVSELLVPLMTPSELELILSKGEELLNIDMSAIKDDIVDYSVGMPSVCHQIALNVCLVKGIEVTQPERTSITREDLKPAVGRSVSELSDTIRAQFDAVTAPRTRTRFANARLILTVLAEGPISGMFLDDILIEIRKVEPRYPKANLSKYLREMAQGGSLLRLGVDGKCRFSEPVYHTVAKATLVELPTHKESATDFTWTFSSDPFLEQVYAGTIISKIYTSPNSWNFFEPFRP